MPGTTVPSVDPLNPGKVLSTGTLQGFHLHSDLNLSLLVLPLTSFALFPSHTHYPSTCPSFLFGLPSSQDR